MASRDPKSGHGRDFSSDQALTELGRTLLRGQAGQLGAGQAGGSGRSHAEIELTLAELLSDDNGEIVFFNDSGARSLGIATEAAVVAKGAADPHVTAGGTDVTGYSFVTFNNGLTFYFRPDLDLIVHGSHRDR